MITGNSFIDRTTPKSNNHQLDNSILPNDNDATVEAILPDQPSVAEIIEEVE